MAKKLQAGLRQSMKASREAGLSGDGVFSRAPLDLRFALQKTLDPRVSFTRASSATFVDSSGLIKTAVTNLLTFSEQFDNAAWGTNNTTISADAAVAPNGATTADKMIETATTGTHDIRRLSISFTSGLLYTNSIYAKADGRSLLLITLPSAAFGSAAAARFDLAAVTATVTTSATNTIASIQPIGDGWYRCSLKSDATATATGNVFWNIQETTGSTSYAGDITKGLFLWGAQLEQASTVGEYVPTTSAINSAPRFDHNPTTGESLGLLVEEARTNLLLQSNQFDTTWTNSNSSETAASGTAPDGTNTAWELKDTSDAVSTPHSLVQSTSYTSGVAYTVSCWMKSGTLTEGGITFPASAFTTAINCRINLATGAVISSSAAVTASTVPYASGWYRVIATATATATSAGSINIRLANGGLSYTGTGTGTILIWGAQIEAGAFPTSYIPTTTATVTRAADVASVTGANFSSFHNQTEGTVFGEWACPVATLFTTSREAISVSDNSFANFISLGHVSGGNLVGQLYVASAANIYDATAASVNNNKAVIGYIINSKAYVANGTVKQTSSASGVPTVSQLGIGNPSNGGAGKLCGTIKRLTYWPVRLANTTLQQITQP
jgi:hypothetical protein